MCGFLRRLEANVDLCDVTLDLQGGGCWWITICFAIPMSGATARPLPEAGPAEMHALSFFQIEAKMSLPIFLFFRSKCVKLKFRANLAGVRDFPKNGL